MNELELSERLDRLSEGVPEPDLVGRAWAEGQVARRHGRRRSALVGLAAAAVLAVVAGIGVLAPDPAPDRTPASTTSSTSSADGLVTHRTIDGIPVDLLPPAERLGELPAYPDSEAVALPERLGWDEDEDLPTLGTRSPLGDLPVRAVMLRALGGGRYHAVLHVPGRSEPWIEVDGVTVVGGRRHGEVGPPRLDGDWISTDRSHVALPVADGVAVVDVHRGHVEIVPVGESIVDLGWAGDGALLAAGEKHWRITGEPGTRTARRSAPLSPRPEDIVAAGPGSSRLQRISYDGAGRRVGVRDLPLEVGGTMAGTVSNIEGWSAASVFLGRSVGEELGAYQGAYAVQIDMSPRPRLLTPPVSDTTHKGGLQPLGWGPRDTLLVLSSSAEGERVLAWDVIGGGVSRAGELVGTPEVGAEERPGQALAAIAL